jgi:hypothetical protein
MKNVFLLRTDKPSRLIYNDANQLCYQSNKSFKNDRKNRKKFNIYITSDEQIEDVRPHKGKWHLEQGQILNKFPTYLTDLSECKLVIMTTDQDLINDGVQAIDDEFLEWFVKNPSCERVEVESMINMIQFTPREFIYKIIIPQEEPKPIHQQIIDIVGGEDRFKEIAGIKPKQETLTYTESAKKEERIFNSTMMSKQETIEEVSIKISEQFDNQRFKSGVYFGVKEGARWQAERMFSEEEVYDILFKHTEYFLGGGERMSLTQWFEQFKKK